MPFPLYILPIPKPPFGALCNGCGVCCRAEVCGIGRLAFGAVVAPCPALQWLQGRWWCGLVLAEQAARHQDATVVPRLAQALAIGRGCDSDACDRKGVPDADA